MSFHAAHMGFCIQNGKAGFFWFGQANISCLCSALYDRSCAGPLLYGGIGLNEQEEIVYIVRYWGYR